MRTFQLRQPDHFLVHYHKIFSGRGIYFIIPALTVWLNQFGVHYSLHHTGDGGYAIDIEDDRQAAHFKLVWM